MALKIVYRTLAQLEPYARNARKHSDSQVAQLQASLVEYGWTNPMLTADHAMIAGHGRLMAAVGLRDRGIAIPGNADPAKGPTIDLSHLSAAQRRAYILADNRLAEEASWDDDLLKVELAELRGMDFDLSLTGFGLEQIDGLFGVAPALGTPPSEDTPSPAGEGSYREQYGVIAICRDEAQQQAVYDQLRALGLEVKVVAT